jgi:hypothetical protein
MKQQTSLKINSLPLTFTLSIFLFINIFNAGCNSLQFKSHWRTKTVDIDGKNTEWQNTLTQIEGKQIMIGILNDSNYLYISFTTDDRAIQRQMVFRGLTIWFDRLGGEEQRFGIQFPLGMQAMEFPPPERNWNQERFPADTVKERFQIDTSDVEIIGPMQDEHHRVKVIELKQIAVKIKVMNGIMVYELKVPLMDNGPDPYAIGTNIGATVGIGLETGKMIERQSSGEFGRNEMPGGMGGRRGRGEGFGSGGRPPRMGQQMEPLKIWAKVQLADSNESN